MAQKRVIDRDKSEPTPTVKRNAQFSATRRRIRPLPATRAEADDLYRPNPTYSPKTVSAPRLVRMVQLGIIPHYTNAEAHELILNAMYGDDGLLIERDRV